MTRWFIVPMLVSILCCAPGREAQPPVAGAAAPEAGAAGPAGGAQACNLDFDTQDQEETIRALAAGLDEAGGIARLAEERGQRPAIRFSSLENRTMEKIDLQLIVAGLHEAMSKSGRADILVEPAAQLPAKNGEKGWDRPSPSDPSPPLDGSMEIFSIDDLAEDARIRLYKIGVKIMNPRGWEMVWIGDHEIKKLCELPPR